VSARLTSPSSPWARPSSGPVVVHADRLGVVLGGRTVLDDVSLWASGGVVAVLGPNGAGKSTLLRCLATLVEPAAGTVHLDGADVAAPMARIEARARLGYVPQRPGFTGSARVFDAVDVLAVCKGLAPEARRRGEVLRVLSAVGVADRIGDRVKTLSGGMLRRVAVAQALLGPPGLLLADEPSADLDPEQRVHLRHLLTDLGRSATVIVSTHHLDEAAVIGDTVVVLDAGRVVWTGPPDALTATAVGRVWWSVEAPPPSAELRLAWRTPGGRWRCLGTPPPDAALADPTAEDAYLLLVGPSGRH